ncbi:phosphate/phosphite/phosphonate ABC transporter substrate-binding protein [Roseovarius sp. C7]|uniref:phosphate/phosphite/phosphonate ABC transporter substrate-binding protein n=1 Tax=Roseovarius sp. C7 TaxID=3398643 RepID=UPI0039F67EF4
MIASLPMYDRPELRDAHDAYWQLISQNLGAAPAALTREGDLWDIWQSPDLVLSQTCGFPYRARLHDKVTLVGTPDYGLPGCPPGHYNSVLVARADDPRDLATLGEARFAYNEPMSQSGWAAPATHFSEARLTLNPVLQTGGHALSARAVANDDADLAAIDALSWTLFCIHEPETATRLRELTRTAPTPALPYIARKGADGPATFDAIRRAIDALAPADRAALHLHGICVISPAAYRAVPTPPPPSFAAVSE